MSWKRSTINSLVRVAAAFAPRPQACNGAPSSIFVLRNNDIGDLLTVTPLFEALRRAFPHTRLVAGVGRWNLPVLENNPHLDAVLEVNAPWHNKFIAEQGLPAVASYLMTHPEIDAIRQERFDLGIDVLGSPWGVLLLMRAQIPRRIAMAGYAGDEPGAQQHVSYCPSEQVGRSALRFAELLGVHAPSLPEARPQIFLRPAEMEAAETLWKTNEASHPAGGHHSPPRPRLLLAPGVGFPAKGWSENQWVEVLRAVARTKRWNTLLVGGEHDVEKCAQLSTGTIGIGDLAGKLTLRQTFALAATTDRVMSHSSMIWHAAAAWKKPTVVVLGECFPSAAAHGCQWGYPESIVLGRESGGHNTATVSEVLNFLTAEPLNSAVAA